MQCKAGFWWSLARSGVPWYLGWLIWMDKNSTISTDRRYWSVFSLCHIWVNLLCQNSLFLVLSVNFPIIKSDAVHFNTSFVLYKVLHLTPQYQTQKPSQSAWSNLMTIYPSHSLCPSFSRERRLQCSPWRCCTHNASSPLLGCAVAGSDNCWAGPREWVSLPHPLRGRQLLSAPQLFISTES